MNNSNEEVVQHSRFLRLGSKQARKCYLNALSELGQAVTNGKLDKLEKISKSIAYMNSVKEIEELLDYHDDPNNIFKRANICILACKSNQPHILYRLLKNNTIMSSFELGNRRIQPTDEDDERHNAFYYAILSSNIQLLESLIDEWPENYFGQNPEILDNILSLAYRELKITKVYLTKKMQLFVENKLIELRFFSNERDQAKMFYEKNILIRFNILLENIDLLKLELETCNMTEKLLLSITFIAQNIHILKLQLKPSYARIPWEEVEFCLIAFASSSTKRHEINLFYHQVLSKDRMVSHIEMFSRTLKEEKLYIENNFVDQVHELPKLSRDQVVKNIIETTPEFQDLYYDYEQLMDIYSLSKIQTYLDIALSADPSEKQGQIIIMRALQVTGEYLQNTLESPNLSTATSNLLLNCVPEITRKTIIDLQNYSSNVELYGKRNFFEKSQNDLEKIDVVIVNILYINKLTMIRQILTKIAQSQNINDIIDLSEMLHIAKFDEMLSDKFELSNHNQMKSAIGELCNAITDKTIYELTLFGQIDEIFDIEEAALEKSDVDYTTIYSSLCNLWENINSNDLNENVIKGIKYFANSMLNKMSTKDNLCTTVKDRSTKYGEVLNLCINIFNSVEPRSGEKDFNHIQMIMFKILHLVETGYENIKSIKKTGGQSNGANCEISTSHGNNVIKGEWNENDLNEKLILLREFLKSEPGCTKKVCLIHEEDRKMQVVIEMLVLDIMSMLEQSTSMTENITFLDDPFPVLTGKNLRNYLAHGTTLNDILYPNITNTITLNAKKLVSIDITSGNIQLGKVTTGDPIKLEKIYKNDLEIITNQTKMFEALSDGSLEDVKSYIRLGADIRGRDGILWTSLHFAAKSTNIKVIKYVLEKNVWINSRDFFGRTPLLIAASYGNIKIVQFLLQHKDILLHEMDNNWQTPLHHAAKNGHEEVVKMLLKYKSNISAKDSLGNAPVHYAVRYNFIEVSKILLQKQTHVDSITIKDQFTCLHLSAQYGYVELVKFLLESKADVQAKDEKGLTPLHTAVFYGHTDVVRVLISNGAKVNARNLGGCTPLYYAVGSSYEEIANILLEHGANVNASDYAYKNTPLHFAAENDSCSIIELLLKYNVDIHASTIAGITSLHSAAYAGNLKAMDLLLSNGANINAQDENGATPLYHCAQVGEPEVVNLLLMNEADINFEDHNKNTALHVAAKGGHKEVVEILLKHGADVNYQNIDMCTALHLCSKFGHVDAVKLLIHHGANINISNKYSRTPLHEAVRSRCMEVIDLLISEGADIMAVDTVRYSVLHVCALFGNMKMVECLIKKGANINAMSVYKSTPLCLAVESGHIEVVKLLIESGSKINMQYEGGVSALIIAVINNNINLVELLLAHGADIKQDGEKCLSIAILSGFRDIVKILLSNMEQEFKINILSTNNYLHKVVLQGHKKILEDLLSEGTNIESILVANGKYSTPLQIAIEKKCIDIIEVLLANGANVNVLLVDGQTPLHIASGLSGNAEIINLLLKYGANANLRDWRERIPIELAVAHNDVEIVKLLLPFSDLKYCSDWSLLHVAAQDGHLEVTKYLIDIGFNVRAVNKRGSKAIHIAARDGYINLVQFYLDNGISIDDVDAGGWTLLHYAALGGQTEIVKFLLDTNINVNTLDSSDSTPLHVASKSNCENIVILLLKHGAKYDIIDSQFRRPVHVTTDQTIYKILSLIDELFEAVKNEDHIRVEYCIIEGVNVNVKNYSEITPLHHACWEGFSQVVDVLLEHKADPNIKSEVGSTPLHYAAKFGHFEIVKALLSRGAVFESMTNIGKTPLDVAYRHDICHLLKTVKEAFINVTNGNTKVIADIKRIKDISVIKAIFNTYSKENKTLISTALHNNFPRFKQLTEILQADVASLINKAHLLTTQEQFKEALNIFGIILEKRFAVLGPDDPRTLETQSKIGMILYKEQQYKKALEILEEVFEKRVKLFGLNHEDTLETKGNIGLVLHRLGKNEESLAILSQVCDLLEKLVREDNPCLLNMMTHKTIVLNKLYKFDEALQINNKIFHTYKQTVGLNHPLTFSVQNNIALLLTNLKRYEQALRLYQDVYEGRKRLLGPNHIDTLRVLHHIQSVRAIQEGDCEYEDKYEKLLDAQRTMLGPNHVDTVNTQINMAKFQLSRGNVPGAIRIYKDTLEQRKVIFGPDHPEILQVEKLIARIDPLFRAVDDSQVNYAVCSQMAMNKVIERCDVDTMETLIENGFHVDTTDADGRTALHLAINGDADGIVELLLRHGADCTLCSNNGNTPLVTAIYKNKSEIVRMLLKHAKQTAIDRFVTFVDAKTSNGEKSGLHIAAAAGYVNIVKILLQYGARYNTKEDHGKTPMQITTEAEIYSLLKLTDDIFREAVVGNYKLIDTLHTLNVDELSVATNARNNEGNTLLQVLIKQKHQVIARGLLEILQNKKSQN